MLGDLGETILPNIKATGRSDRFSLNLMKFVHKYKGKRLFVAEVQDFRMVG